MRILVLADDLTGANATAIRLKYAGFQAIVHITEVQNELSEKLSLYERAEHTDEDHVAHIFNIGTRNLTDVEAMHVLQKYIGPIQQAKGMVSLRIDSTLRGPIAASLDFFLSNWQQKIAVVVPAYPSSGRTTREGIHYVSGVPVHETPAGKDRFSPVPSSDLRIVIGSQNRNQSCCIDLHTVRQGSQAILDKCLQFIDSGVRILFCDAQTDSDIEWLAEAAARLSIIRKGLEILPVDPGPFTSALAKLILASAQNRKPVIFGVSASIMHNAREQMDYLERDPNVGVVRYTGQAPDEIVQVLKGLVQSTPTPNVLFLRTDTWKLSESEVPFVVKKLPLVVQAVVHAFPSVAGIYLSGGETAEAVLAGAGVTCLAMEEELAPLTALCKPLDGAFLGRWIVTKGGAIGDREAVSQVIVKLQETIAQRKI